MQAAMKVRQRFQELLQEKDTAFLGVRGLLKHAVEDHNYEAALDYALEANKLHPKQTWILEGLFDLQIKNRVRHFQHFKNF